MDHLQQARMKVVKYIKNGKISKESGEIALEHVKKFAMQGKMADVDMILQKMGALKPTGPKKKILSAGDDAENPYAQRRKTRSKTPLIIGVVFLVVASVGFIIALNVKSKSQAEHAASVRAKKEAQANKLSGGDSSDTTKALDLGKTSTPSPDDGDQGEEKEK